MTEKIISKWYGCTEWYIEKYDRYIFDNFTIGVFINLKDSEMILNCYKIIKFDFLVKSGGSHLYFRELHKQYGKIVRVRLGPNQTVMLFDPELISQTIANEGAYPVRRSVPIMETYVKRTKRNMLSVQYVHSIHI